MKRHLKLKKEKKREEEDLPVNDKPIVNRILLHWNPLTAKNPLSIICAILQEWESSSSYREWQRIGRGEIPT